MLKRKQHFMNLYLDFSIQYQTFYVIYLLCSFVRMCIQRILVNILSGNTLSHSLYSYDII